jgi:hypothetical protein
MVHLNFCLRLKIHAYFRLREKFHVSCGLRVKHYIAAKFLSHTTRVILYPIYDKTQETWIKMKARDRKT